ncbi:MAG: AraC family transcriptional regulator [Chitinophagaceae bacterium]|nr:AraC family transcriptional regulator [Chitinophagaceae bacterium]
MKNYLSSGKKKSVDSVFLKKAAGIVVSHLEEEHFSGNELAEKLFLSREQTHRKIKQATSLSTGKFIRYIKILKAYSYLLEGNLSVSEIGYKVGFEDPAYFNKCFREETGLSPGEVKKSGDIIPLTKTPLLSFYQLPEIKDQLQKNGIVFEFPEYKKKEFRLSKIWLIAAPLFVVLPISLFFLFGKKSSANKIDLGENDRIAVLPFTNLTGDSALAGIGDIASSWISNQLAELKMIQTVPYFTVKQYQSYIGILPDDPQGRPTFGDLVAARYFINGNYYLKDSQVYFDASFVDVGSLQTIYRLPPMHSSVDSLMNIIEDIRLKFAGLITNLDEVKLGKRNPPNYEAYNAFLTGLHQMTVGLATSESQLSLEKAAALEPDFVMPRIYLIWFYQGKKLDTLLQQIAAIPTITKYEKDVHDYWYQLLNHNYKESLRLVFQNLEKYPGDYFFNLFAGHNAKSLFMPRLAIKVLNQIRDPLPNNEGGIWHYYKVWNYTESLIMLAQYQQAMDYLQSVPLEHYNLAIPHLLINVFVKLGKTSQEVENLIEKIAGEKMKYLIGKFKVEEQKVFAEYYTVAAYHFYLAGKTETARYFAQKAVAVYTLIPGQQAYKFDIIDALYLSGDLQRTKTHLTNELKKNQTNDDLLIYLANVEAAMGNESAALKIFSRYDTLSRVYWRRHEFQYNKDYLKARIYALLGKKEQAFALVKNALDKGQLYHTWDFGGDIFLRSLFDYIPFREIIKPVDMADSTIKQ